MRLVESIEFVRRLGKLWLGVQIASVIKKASRPSVKGGSREYLAGRAGGLCLWALVNTLRVRTVNASGLDLSQAGPVIFSVWHDSIIAAPLLKDGLCFGRRNSVLTSASKDGALLAAAVGVFGLEAVRGSSSRRGAAALVAMRRSITSGCDVTVTPDGPRGPRRELQGGLVKLASVTGAPILPVWLEYGSAWHLKSWDRMAVPRPFSELTIRVEKALEVPPGLDETGLSQCLDELSARMPPKG